MNLMPGASVSYDEERKEITITLPDGFGQVIVSTGLVETRFRNPDRDCVEICYIHPVRYGQVDDEGFMYESTSHAELSTQKCISVRKQHHTDKRN